MALNDRSYRSLFPLSLGFFLLIVSIASGLRLFAQQQEATNWVRHTLEVENRLNHIQILATDAETGQRGFLLTGRSTYLAPHDAAVAQLGPEIGALSDQTADNPAQRREIAQLRQLVDARLAVIDRTIELRRTGHRAQALELVNSDSGRQLMTDIRNVIAGMLASERRLFEIRAARAERLARRTWALLDSSFLILLLLGIWTFRDARLRITDLEATNQKLEAEKLEREAAESQLRQLQKMEAVGQLTGGIAHDFNNMLAIVIGSLDMARRRLTGSEDPAVPRYIDNANEGAERAALLTARLLAFARQQPLDPQVVDANRLVGSMSEMLRRTLGENIEVETVLGGALWRTRADPAQIESTLVNLAVNARDAMPSGGKLTVETANADLDDRYAMANGDVRPGQYVLISVTDTGIGMAPEVIERAFEPFYTTKGVGRGTGLGLSQVFGFAKQSGGHVKIYSEVGHGTTVKLYLPRYHGEERPAARRTDARSPNGSAEEIILVVEDEAQVRAMSVDALRELGYTVIQAATPAVALQQLDLQPKIVLMFTDIVMPEMNGRRLADEALRRRPDLKILYTTGYTRNAVIHGGVLDPGAAFLAKPFSIEQLALKLREVLGA